MLSLNVDQPSCQHLETTLLAVVRFVECMPELNFMRARIVEPHPNTNRLHAFDYCFKV